MFNASQFTLENGLDVVVIENHRAPVVTHMIWYDIGRRDEPMGQSGLAHFLEHLMFKGTSTRPDEDPALMVARLGGRDNAFTSDDYTAYYQSVPLAALDEMMAMEADRMEHLSLTDEQIETERGVILAERSQRTDNDPIGLFFEELMSALYLNHPYATPIIGWQYEIEKLSHAQIRDFYHDWYAPNNATVILSGAITAEQARTMVEKYYGTITRRDVPTRPQIKLTTSQAKRSVHVTSPDVQQPLWSQFYIAPQAVPVSENEQQARDALALEILAEILAGGETSVFYQAFVRDRKLATGADISHSSTSIDPSYFGVILTLAEDVSNTQARAAYQDVIAAFLKNGITEEQLAQAKSKMSIDSIYARDSLMGPAMIVGRGLASGLDLESIQSWPQRLQKITAEDVMRVAHMILAPTTDQRKKPYPYNVLGQSVEASLWPEKAPSDTMANEG